MQVIQRLWQSWVTPSLARQATRLSASPPLDKAGQGRSYRRYPGGLDSAPSQPSVSELTVQPSEPLAADASSLPGQYQSSRERHTTERLLRPEVYSLVYSSRIAEASQPHDQLRAMRARWLSMHIQSDVASAVVYQDGLFFHCYQGDEAEVTALWQRMQRESAEGEVEAVVQGTTARSMLDTWSMGLRSIKSPSSSELTREPFGGLDAWASFLRNVGGLDTCGSLDRESIVSHGEESVAVLSLRSLLGSQFLIEAAEAQRVPIEVTRWGAAADASCDLQTLEAVLDMGGRRTLVGSYSARSLRVGAVREAIRRRSRWMIVLSSDDVAELDQLLSLMDCNTPADFMPQSIWVFAPAWTSSTKQHALHMLRLRGWAGGVHALDTRKRGAWKKLAELIGLKPT